MYNILMIIGFFLIGLGLGMVIGEYTFATPKLNLPEEYKQISQDHYKPDTLLGFYIDNKLHIEFKPKSK